MVLPASITPAGTHPTLSMLRVCTNQCRYATAGGNDARSLSFNAEASQVIRSLPKLLHRKHLSRGPDFEERFGSKGARSRARSVSVRSRRAARRFLASLHNTPRDRRPPAGFSTSLQFFSVTAPPSLVHHDPPHRSPASRCISSLRPTHSRLLRPTSPSALRRKPPPPASPPDLFPPLRSVTLPFSPRKFLLGLDGPLAGREQIGRAHV